MDLRPMALGITGALVVSVCHAGPPTLDLYTFESPPYQKSVQAEDGVADVVGETVDTVTCAANRAGWSTNIQVTPRTGPRTRYAAISSTATLP